MRTSRILILRIACVCVLFASFLFLLLWSFAPTPLPPPVYHHPPCTKTRAASGRADEQMDGGQAVSTGWLLFVCFVPPFTAVLSSLSSFSPSSHARTGPVAVRSSSSVFRLSVACAARAHTLCRGGKLFAVLAESNCSLILRGGRTGCETAQEKGLEDVRHHHSPRLFRLIPKKKKKTRVSL